MSATPCKNYVESQRYPGYCFNCDWHEDAHDKVDDAVSDEDAAQAITDERLIGDTTTTDTIIIGNTIRPVAVELCPECGHSKTGKDGRCVVPGCNCEYSRALKVSVHDPGPGAAEPVPAVPQGAEPMTAERFYHDVWIKFNGGDPRGDWPIRFAKQFAEAYHAAASPAETAELKAKIAELEQELIDRNEQLKYAHHAIGGNPSIYLHDKIPTLLAERDQAREALRRCLENRFEGDKIRIIVEQALAAVPPSEDAPATPRVISVPMSSESVSSGYVQATKGSAAEPAAQPSAAPQRTRRTRK